MGMTKAIVILVCTLAAVGMFAFAGKTVYAGATNPGPDGYTAAVLDTLYCQLTGCDMAGDIDMNGSVISDSTGFLNIGATKTSGYGLTVGDVVVGGKMEVKGNLYPYDIVLINGRWVTMGSSFDSILGYSATQTPDALYMGLGVGSNVFVIGEKADESIDFGHASQTNPTLFLHSASSETTYHINLHHNQTDGVIGVGAGSIKLDDAAIVDSNAANTVAVLSVENTAGDFQVFRTDATPEGAVTGSIGDLANDTTNGTLYLKTSGAGTNTGWKALAIGSNYGSMYLNGNSTASVIETADEPVCLRQFSSGSLSGWTFDAGSTAGITVYADYSGTVAGTVLATSTHGLTTGDIISIRGTTSYNGVFQITVVDATHFYFTDTWVADDGASDFDEPSYLQACASCAGDYLLSWNISAAEGGAAGSTAKYSAYVGDSVIAQSIVQRKFANNDVGAMGGTAIFTVSASDRIFITIESSGTNDITNSYGALVLHGI